jgi:hypothetical protein
MYVVVTHAHALYRVSHMHTRKVWWQCVFASAAAALWRRGIHNRADKTIGQELTMFVDMLGGPDDPMTSAALDVLIEVDEARTAATAAAAAAQ